MSKKIVPFVSVGVATVLLLYFLLLFFLAFLTAKFCPSIDSTTVDEDEMTERTHEDETATGPTHISNPNRDHTPKRTTSTSLSRRRRKQ
ncbi:unnamed protein product [Caenorhabditis auriculariae]|uniref:Uncharacterized protein n=1 Tax=Caenorhabditis auriculariae TaxID=2777116 RepID=A0A8S1GQX2_9PELO|nr:unnamed protein product [Caenorhabditis auriculariae]